MLSPELPAICDKDQRLDVVNGQVLCAAQVVEIYKHKLCLLEPNSFESCLQTAESRIKGQSGRIAGMFGVSPKTVRDIWNHRTWAYATHHLWAQEEGGTASSSCLASHVRHYSPVKYFLFYPFACTIFSFLMCLLSMQAVGLPKRARGRPKGSRDTKPRSRTIESPNTNRVVETVSQHGLNHIGGQHNNQGILSSQSDPARAETNNSELGHLRRTSYPHSDQGPEWQAFPPSLPFMPPRQWFDVHLPVCLLSSPGELSEVAREEAFAPGTAYDDPFHADWPHW